jgi:hypothetical protein
MQCLPKQTQSRRQNILKCITCDNRTREFFRKTDIRVVFQRVFYSMFLPPIRNLLSIVVFLGGRMGGGASYTVGRPYLGCRVWYIHSIRMPAPQRRGLGNISHRTNRHLVGWGGDGGLHAIYGVLRTPYRAKCHSYEATLVILIPSGGC